MTDPSGFDHIIHAIAAFAGAFVATRIQFKKILSHVQRELEPIRQRLTKLEQVKKEEVIQNGVRP